MKGLLVDITKGWKGLGDTENLIKVIMGDMEVFPLCCSTGVLKNLRCQRLKESRDKLYFDKLENNMEVPTAEQIKDATYLHQLIRLVKSNPRFIFPLEVAEWYAMSIMLQKVETGKDDSNVGGYNNFKAAQITFFDRATEDKTNPKFNFANSYCTVYSCDHLMDFLETTGNKFGTVQISPAVPGAHKAKVRGCIFTPRIQPMKEYHDERFNKVKEHIETTTKILKNISATKGTQW